MESIRVIFAVSILGVLFLNGVSGVCKEPSNLNEIKQHLVDEIRDSYLESMSYFNIKQMLSEAPKKFNISAQKAADEQSFLSKIYGDSRCRKRHLSRSGLKDTNERSSCPWYYVLEVDLNREPQTIVQAKCSCNKCLELTGSSYRSSRTGTCKEISYHMPVIRRTCEEGVYNYGIYLEDVAVGCTCQRCSKRGRNK